MAASDIAGDVWLIQRYIPAYAVPRFALLSEALAGRLVVAAGADPAGDDVSTTSFRRHRLRNLWINGEMLVWQLGHGAMFRGARPKTIVAEHSLRIMSLLPLMLQSRLRGVPFILWGHGRGRRSSVEAGAGRNFLHGQLISCCDAYVHYTEGRRREMSATADPRKLFVAQNTLDTRPLFAAFDAIEAEGRASVKNRLGLNCAHYIAFVGRLIEEKRVDLVVAAIRLLREQGWDVGGVVVGDGPQRAELERMASDVPSIRFLGRIDDPDASSEWLGIADVMLAPGTAGLLVNHSLALGMPVVISGGMDVLHGPEIEFVVPGETGEMFEGGAPDAAAAVASVLRRGTTMRYTAADYARRHLGIARWVDGMVSAIDYAARPAAI